MREQRFNHCNHNLNDMDISIVLGFTVLHLVHVANSMPPSKKKTRIPLLFDIGVEARVRRYRMGVSDRSPPHRHHGMAAVRYALLSGTASHRRAAVSYPA